MVLVSTGSQGNIQLTNNTMTIPLASGFDSGLAFINPASNASIFITSNTLQFDYLSNYGSASNVYGLYLYGVASGALVQNNNIVFYANGGQ